MVCVMLFRRTWGYMVSDLMDQSLGRYPCRTIHRLSEKDPSLQKDWLTWD